MIQKYFRFFLKFFGILFLFLFSSCASLMLSQTMCENMDWYNLGEKQALEGKSRQMNIFLSRHCESQGYETDEKLFNEGYDSGLAKFCTFENGIMQGSEGNPLFLDCPEKSNKEYSRGYLIGKSQYDHQQEEQVRRAAELEQQKVFMEGMKDIFHGSSHQKTEEEYKKKFRCVDRNAFGHYSNGGGCNAFGCWPAGGSCNAFGCSSSDSCSAMKCVDKIDSFKCFES